MVDLVTEVETRRQAMRLSQAEIAEQLNISQGHYSKILAGKVPLAKKMSAKMTAWLAQSGMIEAAAAQEILQKCIELMHLVRRHVSPNDGAVT